MTNAINAMGTIIANEKKSNVNVRRNYVIHTYDNFCFIEKFGRVFRSAYDGRHSFKERIDHNINYYYFSKKAECLEFAKIFESKGYKMFNHIDVIIKDMY